MLPHIVPGFTEHTLQELVFLILQVFGEIFSGEKIEKKQNAQVYLTQFGNKETSSLSCELHLRHQTFSFQLCLDLSGLCEFG